MEGRGRREVGKESKGSIMGLYRVSEATEMSTSESNLRI